MGSQYTHRKWKSLLLIVCFRESVVDSKICKNRSQKLANVTVLERLSKNIFDANFTKYLQNHRWWGFILLTLFWWTYFSVVFVWKLSQHFKKFVFQNTILCLSLKEDTIHVPTNNESKNFMHLIHSKLKMKIPERHQLTSLCGGFLSVCWLKKKNQSQELVGIKRL